MRFEDERYVRVYTRDTSTWLMLGFEGQSVFTLLLRKVDRTGVFDLGGSDAAEAVAAVIRAPVEVVTAGLARLLQRGVIERGTDCLIFPKFIDAQEASMAPAARQKESRLRRRDQIRSGLDPSARETVIYFIQSEHGGPIKIGRADDLAKRLVGLQTSRPDELVVLVAVPGTVSQERELHDRFAAFREKGEWFSPCPELMGLIKRVSRDRTLDVPVTIRDQSQSVTSHDLYTVTPSCAVPSRAVPNQDPICPTSPDVGVDSGLDSGRLPDPVTPWQIAATTLSQEPLSLSGLGCVASVPPEPVLGHPRDTRPDEVWEHYVETMKRWRPRRRPTKLRPEDRKTIRKHLDAGLSVDDLKLACEGLFRSRHHIGENDRSTEYLEIEYALRKPAGMIALAEDAAPIRRSEIRPKSLDESESQERVDPAIIEAELAKLDARFAS